MTPGIPSAAAVLAMPAGWQTDATVDHFVMGGVPPQFELLRDAYTVDARAATRLIDHLAARGVCLEVRRRPAGYVAAGTTTGGLPDGDDPCSVIPGTEATAVTFAHAVALCALLCVPHLPSYRARLDNVSTMTPHPPPQFEG